MSGTLRAVSGRVPAPSRLRWSSAVALACTLLVASPSMAQDVGTQATAPTAPTAPPDWVGVGTQVTYHMAQATLPSGVYELVEDPNGSLTDPATGKRYRESYGGSATGPTGGAGSGSAIGPTGGAGSGEGFLQFTVAGLDGEDVLLSTTSLQHDPMSGTTYGGPTQVSRSASAAPGLPWIHPDILSGYRSGGQGQRLILTGDLSLGGTTYETISVVDPTAGAYSLVTYDVASGVVLQSAQRSLPQAGGPAMLGTLELRGIRDPRIPGVGAAVPGWLTRDTVLRYAGTQRWTNTFDASWQDFPATLEITFPEVGPTWARFANRTAVTMLTPVEGASEGIIAGAGPYWYDPAALAEMTEGQVLDSDPVTGQSVTVARLSQGQAGPMVTIALRLDGVEGETTWDVATGVTLAETLSTQATGVATHVELQAMP